MTDDLPFSTPAPDPTRPERAPAKCRRHEWTWISDDPASGERCRFCPQVRDVVRSRRGRNNRKRGTSDELAVARLLGGNKVGPLTPPSTGRHRHDH